MDDQDPDQRKRFESFLLDYMIRTARMASIESPPPIPINTPPPAAAQNKGKSIVGSGTQSGFNDNNPLPPYPPVIVEIPKYLSQQEASSSAPRMIGSSSQFPVDAYRNWQNPTWNTFWMYTDFRLVQLLRQTPYNLWIDSYLQLAVQRKMQFVLHLLILLINEVLNLRSMAFLAPMFDMRDSHYFARQAGMNYTPFPFHRRPQFGADQICSRSGEWVISSFLRQADTECHLDYHNWVVEVVPDVNIGNTFSRLVEANFLVSIAAAEEPGLKNFADFYEKWLHTNSQSMANTLMDPLNPVSAIWSERDFQQLESLIQTPYFMWSNTGFDLAFQKMGQLVVRLLLLKMEAGQIPFPWQQAIPPNVRVPAPQRQRELSPQLSSTNDGQDSKTGEVDGSFDLNKKDDAEED